MSEWLPRETLQGTSGPLGALLATWLIWPILCGLIGLRKGELGRGAMHGLLWGPIGLFIVLLAQRKYACPTCGQKTLKTPHIAEARPIEAAIEPEPRVRPSIRPMFATERREAAPLNKEDREKVFAAACAGYDAEEVARLRSWLNNE